ncbi:hypothetical protein EIP86_010376 [Pleurotus ostreatoroseus]|nr:hypothetical protein EIP86_010376 [Pleurotus ostreatoroseus]
MAPSVLETAARATTPPRTVPPDPSITETPCSAPKTQDRKFKEADIEGKRDSITFDASPKTRQVSVDYFLKHVLPPLHKDLNLTEVIEELRENQVIHDDRFTDFEFDPIDIDSTEARVFAAVEKMADRIIQTAEDSTGLKPTVKFLNLGNVAPDSQARDWSAKPDFVGVLTPWIKGQILRWFRIVLSGEWKKINNPKNLRDDQKKVAGNVHHCLCEDVTRRFTYGITGENTEMRLWFVTRGYVFISKCFNFITDYRTTTQLFLSLAFAPETQLGCDPTITRRSDGKFDIVVFLSPSETRTFRTVELISDRSVDTMNGPGTRVWTVQEVRGEDVDEQILTLKEQWVEEDRSQESSIVQSLSVANPSDPYHAQTVDSLFPHVVCDGDVYIEGQLDSTEKLMLRGAPVPPKSAIYNIHTPPPTSSSPDSNERARGDYETPTEQKEASELVETPTPIALYPRVRRRTVYREKFTPLYEETSLYQVFMALCKSCVALQTMHEAGFVHRNLSTAAIVMDQDGQLRLTNLEDSKHVGSTTPAHPERFTCLDFLAVEVQCQKYLFHPLGSKKRNAVARRGPALQDLFRQGKLDARNEPSPVPSGSAISGKSTSSRGYRDGPEAVFRYNELHDMESLWWVALYSLAKRQPFCGDDACEPIDYEKMKKYRVGLFMARTTRHLFFASTEDCNTLAETVHPSLYKAIQILDDIREILVEAYCEAEKKGALKVSVQLDGGLYTDIAMKFKDIAEDVQTRGIVLKPHEEQVEAEDTSDLEANEEQETSVENNGSAILKSQEGVIALEEFSSSSQPGTGDILLEFKNSEISSIEHDTLYDVSNISGTSRGQKRPRVQVDDCLPVAAESRVLKRSRV